MKKIFTGRIAVALALMALAFTESSNKSASKFTVYWFNASNTTSNCTMVTLTFPATIPPTSHGPCGGSTNICALAFPNYILSLDGTYHPSNDGVTEVTNYCSNSGSILKP